MPAPNNGEGSHHLSIYLGGATRVDLFLQHAGQPAPALGLGAASVLALLAGP